MPNIINLSSYGRDVLSSARGGFVHSVYSKTINISTGGELLSLQAQGTPCSPLTLETNCTAEALAAMNLAPQMQVFFSEDGIYIEAHFFAYACASPWDCSLKSRAASLHEKTVLTADFLKGCLRKMMPVGGFSDLTLPQGQLWKSSVSALEAHKILARCESCIVAQKWEAAAEVAMGLVGLGEGLTPSGDDFLCGMLAGEQLFPTKNAEKFCAALREKLVPQLNKTCHISAAFLRCAIDGNFSQAVISLADGGEEKAVTESFAAIGHSSGADTLNGIIFFAQSLNQGGKHIE